MWSRIPLLVNVLCTLLLVGCEGTYPTDPVRIAPSDAPLAQGKVKRTVVRLSAPLAREPLGVGLPAWSQRRWLQAPPPQEVEPSGVSDDLPALTGRIDGTRGAELTALIDALPAERKAMGMGGLPIETVFGEDFESGVCDDVRVVVDDVGTDNLEMAFFIEGNLMMEGAPQVVREPLSESCVQALLDEGGVSSTTCPTDQLVAHYPTGSDCRSCLEVDGDHARCVDEAQCPVDAPVRWSLRNPATGESTWFYVLTNDVLMCAPQHHNEVLYLVSELEEDGPPKHFQHDRYEGACLRFWRDSLGEQDLYCGWAGMGGSMMGDTLYGKVAYLREKGSDRASYADRRLMLRSVQIEGGPLYDTMYYAEQTIGTLSLPAEVGGWGLPPDGLRPDGTTYLRDWRAALWLKTSSNVPNVPIVAYNANRCRDWQSLPDGRSLCADNGPNLEVGWYDDVSLAWWDDAFEQALYFPWTTLASSGNLDPDSPGGLLPHIMGSSTLAHNSWEGCGYPQQFEPDLAKIWGPEDPNTPGRYTAFDGETYRFRDDDPNEVTMALATSTLRYFCPSGP